MIELTISFFINAEVVVMFASEEAEKGQVVVKVLGSGEQSTHAAADVVAVVTASLSVEEDA